jgi:anti-sigma factor RsiW
MTPDTPTDIELVAYIDGEMTQQDRARVELAMAQDEGIGLRIAALSGTTFGMRKAFAPLLSEAPVEQMLASLAGIPTKAEPQPAQIATKASGGGRRWMIAASLALVALGGLGDHLAFAPKPVAVAGDSGHWRDIVASYVRLYTPQTFANVSDDTTLQTRQLQTVGRAMGLHLDPKTIAFAGLQFKQAQLLQYDATPIAELNYLDPQYGPMSLCIMPSNAAPSAPEAETRRGLNVSYWNDGHRAFMVIGAQPASFLGEVARRLGATLASISVDQNFSKSGITI